MGYTAFTAAEIAQGKFFTTTLTTKMKNNFDYLYGLGSDFILPINGSFETDTDSNGIPDNWTRSLYAGGSGGLYTTAPAHGAKAAYFTHPGGTSNGGGYLESDYIEVSQLQSLSLFYITWASAAGMKNEVRVRYYDRDKAYVSDVALYSSVANPASATLYCSQFIPAATARYIKIRLIGGFTDTDVAGTAYFDGLWFVPAVVEDSIKDASVTQSKLGASSVTEGKLGASAVAQAKLKTSIGSVQSPTGSKGILTLPGGQYGFYPQIKMAYPNTLQWYASIGTGNYASTTSYATKIFLGCDTGSQIVYAQQRYVTASGEVHWIFILRDKITKKTIVMYQAPDHPCFGNGGKPLLVPHPFGDYDETKHEIIVINPSLEEIEQMELETIVDDETKPDKDLLEIITENYEIDEDSNLAWPSIPVTIGLPKHVKDKKTGKKILADYRFMPVSTVIEPIKKVIPHPSYILVKSLKKKYSK